MVLDALTRGVSHVRMVWLATVVLGAVVTGVTLVARSPSSPPEPASAVAPIVLLLPHRMMITVEPAVRVGVDVVDVTRLVSGAGQLGAHDPMRGEWGLSVTERRTASLTRLPPRHGPG